MTERLRSSADRIGRAMVIVAAVFGMLLDVRGAILLALGVVGTSIAVVWSGVENPIGFLWRLVAGLLFLFFVAPIAIALLLLAFGYVVKGVRGLLVALRLRGFLLTIGAALFVWSKLSAYAHASHV